MNQRELIVLGLVFLFISADSATAGEASFGFGKSEVAVTVGYAHNIGFPHTVQKADYVYLAPHIGIGISDPLGGNSWYRGNFELIGEGAYLHEFNPKSGDAWGGSLLVRYNFLTGTNLIPFLETGAGLLALNFNIENQRDGLSYTGHWGFGGHYFLTEQTAFTTSLRFHHISNGQNKNNGGINAPVFALGISYFFSK